MIKYSIIVPHYNVPKLLERLLNSIPDRDDIQVVIVDDCSPGAELYLSKYDFLSRKNVEFHLVEKNGGGGKARNEGLKYAKGKWLLFADSDDFFVEDFDKILDKYFELSDDVIYFNVSSVDSENVELKASRNLAKENLFEKYRNTGETEQFRYRYYEPWGKMVRRQFVEDNLLKFDETKVANDYFFSVSTGCLAKTIKVVDEILYVITFRSGSVSAAFADSKEKLLTRLSVYLKVQLFLEKHGVVLKPMPIRGLMVILMKQHFLTFVKQLFVLKSKNVSIIALLQQMFDRKYMSR